jgi:hypothetical protein
MFANDFKFEKNRTIVFDLAGESAETSLRHCISLA